MEDLDRSPEVRERPTLAPGQLTDGWRWVLAVSWGLIGPALIALGDAAHTLGKPPWWMTNQAEIAWWSPVAVVPVVLAAVAAATNHRWWPGAGWGAATFLLIGAVVDWSSTPGIARAEAALAIAGAAATTAAVAGRVRRPG